MPDFIAPATITIKDATGATQTVTVAAPHPIDPPPTGTPSPLWASIPPNAVIVGDDLRKWTVDAGGHVMVNAAPAGSTSQCINLVKGEAGKISHQTGVDQSWWDWIGEAWVHGTDPRPGAVQPPIATGTPRAKLIAYLQDVSGKNNTLFGQTSFPDNREFNEVAATYSFAPAIMFNDPWVVQWSGNAPYDGSFIGDQLRHAAQGGIVGMSLMLPNPVTNGSSFDTARVDPTQIVTPGTALNAKLTGYLDQAAGLLQQHKAAGNAVLVRYMFELDGPWFWWGYGKFSGPQQTTLFRYIADYLQKTKGLDNILTTFAVNGGPGTYEYPGDDWVAVVGIDAYTNSLAATYKSKYDTLRQQAPSKLYAMTEYGTGDPNGPNPQYDLTLLKRDLMAALPRCCYANFWSGWQPTKQLNGKPAMTDSYHIKKSEVHLP